MIHRENKKTLEEAKHGIAKHQEKRETTDDVPAPDELSKFTETLDDYARELLPPRRSSRRTGSSASAASVVSSEPIHRRSFQSASRTRADPSTANTGNTANPSNNTSPTSSSVSGDSLQPPVVTPSTASDVSSGFDNIPDVGLPPNTQASVTIEHPGMRAREYVNDPNGNILSPPVLRQTRQPSKTVIIRGHTITLDATSFNFNEIQLNIGSRHRYTIADMFFSALKEHGDKLDELNQVLRSRHKRGPDWKWSRIPGWEVTSHSVNMLPITLGIQTLREAGSFGAPQK